MKHACHRPLHSNTCCLPRHLIRRLFSLWMTLAAYAPADLYILPRFGNIRNDGRCLAWNRRHAACHGAFSALLIAQGEILKRKMGQKTCEEARAANRGGGRNAVRSASILKKSSEKADPAR
ncbi:DUF2512 family protein [Parageobacillus thermoglucosidasius]|nr:DUF2512 family protein [Parageobacillus thermoglucosidasius]REK58205.1 MAG: DUF2512 domain-containing protein [Geobacillus sp.]